MALIKATICLKTGKVLNEEIIDKNVNPDLKPLIRFYIDKLAKEVNRKDVNYKNKDVVI